MIDNIVFVVQLHGYPSRAIPSLVLLEYVCDLFLYFAVLVPILHMLDVVIVRRERQLRYIQQQRDLAFMSQFPDHLRLLSWRSSSRAKAFNFLGKHSPLSTFVIPLSDPLRPSA